MLKLQIICERQNSNHVNFEIELKHNSFICQITYYIIYLSNLFVKHVRKNYKNFNVFTIKIKYFFSLIDENLNKLNKIVKYINIDLIVVYHRLRIKHKNE